MAIKTAKAAHSTADSPGPASAAGGGIAALLPSWRRSLVARRISPRTIATYTTSVERLAGYLAEHGMPSPATETRRTWGRIRGLTAWSRNDRETMVGPCTAASVPGSRTTSGRTLAPSARL